jgi:hypothetical protein
MKRIHTLRRLCLSLATAAALVAATAAAATAAPQLSLATLSPDHVTAGKGLVLVTSVQNTGDQPLSGDMTVRYTFPIGIPPADPINFSGNMPDPVCNTVGQVDECTVDVTGIQPGVQVRFRTFVFVDPSAAGTLTGSIEVSGGGTANDLADQLSMTVGPSGPFAVKDFGVTMSDAPRGVSSTQAGTDPMEVDTSIRLLSEAKINFDLPSPNLFVIAPSESARDIIVHVPKGFVGNPTATPLRCTASQLTTPLPNTVIPECPAESQIGVVQLNGGDIVPIYNIEPPIGSPAEFGFFYQSIVVTLLARLRPSDNGIDIVTQKVPSSIPIPKFAVTLWGVPGDSSHDPLRTTCLQGFFGYNGGNCALQTDRVPFLRTPTSCSNGPLNWGVDVDTYQHPGTFVPSATTTPGTVGCEANPFRPGLSLVPSTLAPHAASGVDATVTMDQDYGPDGLAPSDVRATTVTLPAGMTINPSSADGLQACTDAQLGLRQEGAAACPDASKLGTVTLRSPLLDHEVGGSIFLRTQNSDDPLSGELFRIALEIRSDDDGVDIKLPGAIKANPVVGKPESGQLTTVFDDLPQLPFESMKLHFKSGPRAPLASPSTCGVHATEVDVVSWGNTPVHTESSFVTSGCKAPRFEPTFRAGIENPVAGSSSPFHVVLNRTDDDQQFGSLSIDTPKGLLGRIKDAKQCSSAAAEAGTCPDASLIGHATVGAGVGNPFFISNGRVYLTGPYRTGPYGLAVVVDAVAGPFSLGKVVVRQAINVNPRTTQLRVVSDPFPTILKGVPLQIRSVRVAIDKPHFMVAPTNCSKQQMGGVATSVEGKTYPLTSRFQVGSCKSLKFAPKLSLSVGSRGHTRRGNSTPFKAVLTQTPGQSNMKSVTVSLPQTLAALLPVVNRACTLAEYQAGRCRKAQAGSAVARTPLLKDPLRGGAFFVRHPGRPLPDLMVRLRGDIALDLVGRVTIPGGTRLATNFDTIPDAPVSKFTLSIVSGSHGPLGVSTNLCSRRGLRSPADVEMIGQNGDVITRSQRLHVSGCVKKHHR